MQLLPLLPIFEYTLVITLGLVLGSFATAIIYREINGLSWALRKKRAGDASPYRSSCPHCKTALTILDLVPVLSWVMLRGQCRHCKNPIAPLYPLTEITSLFACLGVYWAYGFTPQAGVIVLTIPFLLSLIVVDLKKMILPNTLVLIAGMLGVVHMILIAQASPQLWPVILNHAGAAILYSAVALTVAFIAHKILKKAALGMGDVKLFAVAGLWLGLMAMAEFYVMSGFIGIIIAIIWQKITKSRVFPFGPAMIISLYSLLLAKGSFLLHFIIQ